MYNGFAFMPTACTSSVMLAGSRASSRTMQFKQQTPFRAAGFSLMETMIATALSLIVTSTMVAMMSGSLSHTARIIKMTKLTDDLRTSLQMMTRDVRRSNYTANAVHCFANPDCATDGSLGSSGDVLISENKDCFVYHLDRDHDGDATENPPGGFRWVQAEGQGVIEMWIGDSDPDCAASDANWAALTDPQVIRVTEFLVDDGLSYTEVTWADGDGNQAIQKVRKVRLSISAQLASDESIQRTMVDVIKLRNNLYF